MTAEELLGELRVEYISSGHHHCREGWVQLRTCPFCSSDNYHFGFNRAQQYFACWRCGGHGPAKTLKALGASPDLIRQFFQSRKYQFFPTERPAGKLVEPKGRGPLKRVHREYLRSRGYDPDLLANLWDLEGIGLSPRLAWRIYIPVVQQGVRVSWTTRAIGKVPQRYLSASPAEESVPHKHCLYGADLCGHCVVIVEGPADAWRIGPGAVALFGTGYTTAQVRRLSRFPFRYVLFDNEVHAQQQAKKLAADLSCFAGKTTILQCDADDPGKMKRSELYQLKKLVGLSQ